MFWSKCKPSDAAIRDILRAFYQAEALCGGVVLGIVSWYLAHWNDTKKYPGARLCFTEIIAGLATVYGSIFIWTWDWFPRLSALINLLFSLAFFAAYGALIAWEYDKNWVGWKADMGESYKACWRAVEAFTFINGVLFLHSAGFALENSDHTPYQHNAPQGHGNSSTAPMQQV